MQFFFKQYFCAPSERVRFYFLPARHYGWMIPLKMRIKNYLLGRSITHITVCTFETRDGCMVTRVGKAHCSSTDTFKRSVGERLALRRAFDKFEHGPRHLAIKAYKLACAELGE